MESLRAVGYTLQAAIADLIDNSITAGARNVWITFAWAGSASTASVLDDGSGMNEEELVTAMRLGSRSAVEARSSDDLGRYGLGLKTASLSQCRSVTVASKPQRGRVSTRRWDLDHVTRTKEWQLLWTPGDGSARAIEQLGGLSSGTAVVWERMDKLVGDSNAADATARRHFLEAIRSVEAHVAMVFHRYMSGPRTLTFWINDQRIAAWDPFLANSPATQRLSAEVLGTGGSKVTVEPYVLPHHTRLTTEQYEIAGGPAGWNAHQGFYVYRNRRLLLAGDWLGLGFRKEEHYKLARILLDLPNSVDHDWEIDVRKSRARPPLALRDDLRRIARVTRNRAVTVYRHRGKTLARSASTSPIFVWQKRIRNQRVSYVINREHPLVKEALQQAAIDRTTLHRLLRLVEEYIPVQQIWVDAAEGDETQTQPFESAGFEEVVEFIQVLYRALRSSGMPHEKALERLGSTEAFGDRYELVEAAIAQLRGR